VLVLAWPGATIVVIAWLFAVQMLVAGVLQLVSAFAAGVLSVLGGAIVLIYPGTSLVVLTWLFGSVLVVVGVVLAIQDLAARRTHTTPAPEPAAANPG
jgi:uncharacterized membrane protein HdeD (DUF308 family)